MATNQLIYPAMHITIVQLKESKSGYIYIWNKAATKIEKLAVQGIF